MIIRNALSFIKGKGADNKSRFSNSQELAQLQSSYLLVVPRS